MILGFAPIARRIAPLLPHSRESRAQPLLYLREALNAIYDGRWDDAEKKLAGAGEHAVRDARFLNLLGIICQGRRQWKQARRFFGQAIKADSSYAPAEQNMRRLYELHAFGRTDLPIALIDLASIAAVESRIALPLTRQ